MTSRRDFLKLVGTFLGGAVAGAVGIQVGIESDNPFSIHPCDICGSPAVTMDEITRVHGIEMVHEVYYYCDQHKDFYKDKDNPLYYCSDLDDNLYVGGYFTTHPYQPYNTEQSDRKFIPPIDGTDWVQGCDLSEFLRIPHSLEGPNES